MNTPLSPLTNANNTRLAATFKVRDIIDLYRVQLNMDVSSYFTKSKYVNLFECRDTGYKFYHPLNLAGDGPFYELLQKKLKDEYYHAWKFENQLALDNIKSGDKVLDIGCGVGNFLVRAKEKSAEVYGLELNKDASEVCREKGLDVYNELIEEHALAHTDFYDVVVMFQVLEHISDVDKFIKASLQVLKPGGKLVIGVPNNEPYFAGYDKFCTLNLPPHHMGFWNIDIFKKFAILRNLKIVKVAYDIKGKILTHAYLRAKYLAGVKSLPGKHSIADKLKMMCTAIISVPESLIRKAFFGIKGSHIAILFEKSNPAS